MKWFQKVATGVFCLFIGLLILVVVVAYSRPSGSTGMDMAKVQKIRYDSDTRQIATSEKSE